MSIITKVNNFDEEWEKWITCKCTKCDHKFDKNTEELDLEEENPTVTCPNCNHKSTLTLIGPV